MALLPRNQWTPHDHGYHEHEVNSVRDAEAALPEDATQNLVQERQEDFSIRSCRRALVAGMLACRSLRELVMSNKVVDDVQGQRAFFCRFRKC